MGADKYKKNGISRESVEIIIYILIAFGVNYLIGLPLLLNHCVEPGLYTGFMVLLPANGVFLVKKFRKERDNNARIARPIMLAILLITFVIIALRALRILSSELANNTAAIFTVIGSIVLITRIWLRKDGKGLFYNFELIHKDIVILILVLIAEGILDYIWMSSNAQSVFGLIFGIVGIPFMFLFDACAFFGEEYGWRGFLQVKMQTKLGKRKGVILLGFIWELWHIPLWFTAYDLEWWQIPCRFILTISMAVFLGYLYMKTKNVWICALAHCINNTISGTIDNTLANSHINFVIYVCTVIIFSTILFSYIFKKEYNTESSSIR